MTKHIHAELMLQYAQDAMTTDEPWLLWEIYDEIPEKWRTMTKDPMWCKYNQYRRKPKTIKIGDIDVPEPVKAWLTEDEEYWCVDLDEPNGVTCHNWDYGPSHHRRLERGLIHLTRENALKHFEALIKLSGANR